MRRGRSDAPPLAGAAAAMIAVAGCAGLPALGAVLGGLTVAAVLGVTGGVVVAAAPLAAGVFAVRARRGGRFDSSTHRPGP